MLSPLAVLSSYPSHDYTLHALFASRCSTDPARPFLFFDGAMWTWEQFHAAVTSTARMLTARGMRRGCRMAIMAANSYAHPLLLFALARIGAILVPVNSELGAAEARYVLNHAGVSAVACSSDTLEVVTEACGQIEPAPWLVLVDAAAHGVPALLDAIEEAPVVGLPGDICADDTCAIIYSSGTTGFPKGVMHSQRNYVLAAEVHLGRTRLQPQGRVLCMLPMFHINALFYSLGSAVAAGASVVIAARFSAARFWHLVADCGVTHTTIMAAVSAILARRPREEFVPGHRLSVVNGSGFTAETLRIFKQDFGVGTIIEGYGMSEVPAAIANPFDGPHKLGSMGKPCTHPDPTLKWIDVRVVDDRGNDVADGQSGELIVRSAALMQGYYRDPEQTAASFRGGWFMTGDLVRRDAEGYFHFIARNKDIIRRRGENIAGAELDRVIGEHPAVAEAAAIAVEADIGEEEIMAVVVARPDASLSPEDIRDWCAAHLAAHKVPRFVVLVPELPHTATQKVAKFLLKGDAMLRSRAVDLESSGARR
ncbi:MAG: AMP-binding protein [Burkholderiales bacterium]|nr:AMP-binding protein [Burkholderiales bacterium]